MRAQASRSRARSSRRSQPSLQRASQPSLAGGAVARRRQRHWRLCPRAQQSRRRSNRTCLSLPRRPRRQQRWKPIKCVQPHLRRHLLLLQHSSLLLPRSSPAGVAGAMGECAAVQSTKVNCVCILPACCTSTLSIRLILLLPTCRPAKAATQAEKENAPAEQPPAAQGSLAAALAAIRRSGGGAAAAQVAAKAVAAAGNQNVQQEKQQQQAAAADGGQAGKRKRRLLPSAPISIEMRAALGEVDGESVPLSQQMAARQAAAAAPADGGAKRSRRQTQFFRL